MKKIILTILVIVIALQGFNQKISAAKQEPKNAEKSLNKKDGLSAKLEALETVKSDTTLSLRVGIQAPPRPQASCPPSTRCRARSPDAVRRRHTKSRTAHRAAASARTR